MTWEVSWSRARFGGVFTSVWCEAFEDRMATRFPYWVWVCTWLLAVVAGAVNATTLLSFERQAVTHLTGTTSLIAIATVQGNAARLQHLLAVLSSFLVGAMLSGLVISEGALKLGRRYGFVLCGVALLLLTARRGLEADAVWGIYAAALACGLQNAMVTAYSGTVIRTSHVTGMFTDIGIFLGHWLRGGSLDVPRFQSALLIISGFAAGGAVTAWQFPAWSYASLNLPIVLLLLLALAHVGSVWAMRLRSG